MSRPPRLRPFFCYYGGKWRLAPRYPAPRHRRVVEPFAGAAGYSTLYYDKDVVLVERDPRIARLWRLILHTKFTGEVVRSLPLWDAERFDSVDDADFKALLPDFSDFSAEACADLIGFWFNKGAVQPHRRPSSWALCGLRPNSHWGSVVREKIAEQIGCVKHWALVEGDWSDAPDASLELGLATYFVDPPYRSANLVPGGREAGQKYRFSSRALVQSGAYEQIAAVSTSLAEDGAQVIVCEGAGADWMPFQFFADAKASHGKQKVRDAPDRLGKSAEVYWTDEMLSEITSAPVGATRLSGEAAVGEAAVGEAAVGEAAVICGAASLS